MRAKTISVVAILAAVIFSPSTLAAENLPQPMPTDSSDVHVASKHKKAAPNVVATSGTVQSGLQLALADAAATRDQALALAGSDKKARAAALKAYAQQVSAIKKALGVKK